MGKNAEIRLTGIAASPGIAMGPVMVIGGEMVAVSRQIIKEDEVPAHIGRLHTALTKSKADIQKMLDKAKAAYGDEAAQIFQVHLYILEDPLIVDESESLIRHGKINADFAFSEVMDKYIAILSKMQDELFRGRTADIRDLKRRVLRYIQGVTQQSLADLNEPIIVFAKELTPSDTIRLERSKVLGFAMDLGSRTSHATILARSIGVPAVVGLAHAGEHIVEGKMLILDGDEGLCFIHPTEKTVKLYKKRYDDYQNFKIKLKTIKNLPARTKDGKDIGLVANIEFPEELDSILDLQGDGIGLFRTEYLFLSGQSEPSEEQQFSEYRNIAEKLHGKQLVIRTFDLGGDKPPVSVTLPHEANPFLGVRGVRLYRNGANALFRTQMRAILRASAFGDVRLMFPMISCVTEIRYCKKIINEIQAELDKEGVAYNKNIAVGAMIEVPSAAATADIIADECDFLSIGTNDLIQYTVAVDRGNKNLDYLYQPYNPAVLRFIQQTIIKGHEQGAWVAMCGEMASDPIMTMVLIGMGLDEFSVSPVSHLLLKEIIRNVDFSECVNLAKKALDLHTSDEVHNYLNTIYHKKFDKVFHS